MSYVVGSLRVRRKFVIVCEVMNTWTTRIGEIKIIFVVGTSNLHLYENLFLLNCVSGPQVGKTIKHNEFTR